MRLIPQYSIRRLLLIMTGSAVAFSVVALALRGHPWALGVAVGLLALVILGLVYGVTFALFWLAAELLAPLQQRSPPSGQSPDARGWDGKNVAGTRRVP